MTLDAWVRGREPAPPPRLLDRMEGAIADAGVAGFADHCEGSRVAAVKLVKQVVARGDRSRAAALDLLAADALITYSCEAACDEPESLENNMRAAVSQLAGLLPSK